MQEAFHDVMAWFHPEVTSVMHGEHVANSAHDDGRAIDVGSFNGTPVGFNGMTWEAIMYAILSHKFSRIGTIPEIATNPEAQRFAEQNGVVLFTDVGSGPHAHMEVAP